MSKVKAISLFSGGLDSICATRLIMEQGIDVVAIKFVTPFFGYDILENTQGYKQQIWEKYGIRVRVIDISDEYLKLLRNPSHGFGRYFNPCIDCKIFMFSRARTLMRELGGSFLISGEVLGQRPMSQRRDTLNVIERDSGNKTVLLRPLSAKLMPETQVEIDGLVDREKLCDFSGRGRTRQVELAQSFGITDYPSPAGGCILADPILSRRIAKIYAGEFLIDQQVMNVTDILMMLIGRQFRLPGGGWLILGRDQHENLKLDNLYEEGDIRVDIEERPGPTAILRRAHETCNSEDALSADIRCAAGLVVRFAKKVAGQIESGVVIVEDGSSQCELRAEPISNEEFDQWLI